MSTVRAAGFVFVLFYAVFEGKMLVKFNLKMLR